MKVYLDKPRLSKDEKWLNFNVMVQEGELAFVLVGFRLKEGFIHPPALRVGSGRYPTWMNALYASESLAKLIYEAAQEVTWPEKENLDPLFPFDIACSDLLLNRTSAAKVFPSIVR